MKWRDAITMDRVPVLTLIAFLFVSWASTVYFLNHSVVTVPSPFTPVWAAYNHADAARLVSWAVCGLLLALLFPLPGHPPSWVVLISTIGKQVRPLSWLWILVTFGAMAALVATKGRYLLEAPQYLIFMAPPALVSASSVAQPMAVLAAGFLSVRHPFLGRIAMVLWLVLLFACATRVFAGVVVLYMAGRFLAGGQVSWLGWLYTAVITVVLLPIPLYCRDLTEHGLVPYAALGEWASFGGFSLMLFTLAWGLVVRGCLRSVGSNPHPTMVLFLAALLGMAMLTVVMITQYNTRAVNRIISMMIAVAILERVLRPATAAFLQRRSLRVTRTRGSTVRGPVADAHTG